MSHVFVIALGNKVRSKLAKCLGEDNPIELGEGSYEDITAPIDGDGIYISSKYGDGLNYIDTLKQDYPDAKILIGWNERKWNKIKRIQLQDKWNSDINLEDRLDLFIEVTKDLEELEILPNGTIDPTTLDIITVGEFQELSRFITYYK